ncbi:diguanylate cyclase [Candidatus Omnitrophota bacterium]
MSIPAYTIPALVFIYLILFALLIRRHLYSFRLSNIKNENLKEEINTLSDQIKGQRRIRRSLEHKIIYYNNLRDITDKIQNLSIDEICRHLVDYTYYLLGRNKGCCMLYLVEAEKHKLNLFLSKKQNPELVIKHKQGDVFDRWVIRHTSSLLVEDVKADFRFDLEKTGYSTERTFSSLISSPLKVEQRFLGLLRLDSGQAYFFTQEDLRFLDTVCNVGGLGLENSLLFKRIQELAIRDSLTTLYTKGYFLERLNEQIQRAARLPQGNLSLLMIDIDNFKNYNDHYGHIAGDIVLKALSRIFLEFFSAVPQVTICRFGGEEFSISLPDITKKKCEALAERLRSRVEEQGFILRRKETQVTVSIGLADLSAGMRTAQELILKADRALYQAKEKGRNRVCIS